MQLSNLSKIEYQVYCLRDPIKAAAIEFNVSPEIIGAILLDELQRRSLEDDIEEILAQFIPQLVYYADWSIGIAQIKPKTAERTYQAILKQQHHPNFIVKSLLDASVSCRLIAAYIRYIINLWKSTYPPAEQTEINASGAKLVGTLYSMGEMGSRGVNASPQFNRRGEGIVATMPLIHDLINLA
ncbi:MAG: hypothetical protein WBA77_18455 [Microcoleaceae cyanobacterium]